MTTYLMHCDCQAVIFSTEGAPAAKAYCHCADCREFYATTVFAATAWKKTSLSVIEGESMLGHYQHPHKKLARYFCLKCGDTLFGTNRIDMHVVPNKQTARISKDAEQAMQPEFHLFYRHRVIDVNDALPKYSLGRSSDLWRPS